MLETNKPKYRILIIDDNESIHQDFRMILGKNNEDRDSGELDETKAAIFGEEDKSHTQSLGGLYELDSAYQGQEGLEMIKNAEEEGNPYVMVFVDVRMPPGWDGIETMEKIWEFKPELQAVICTAYSDYSWGQMIQRLGQTDRLLILKKPFDNIEVRQIVCSLTEKWNLLNNLENLVQERTRQVTETRDITVLAMASLAESRDPETGAHLDRIRKYCQVLAEELREGSPYSDVITDTFLEDLYRSSPLHDIGKVGIPDKILLKPGYLTESEILVMQEHVSIGAESLEKTVQLTESGSFLSMAAEIARYHHERFDGSGYMEGLSGDDIPLPARIVAVADVYDALTSARVYKPAFRPQIAKLMIEEERNRHFDPIIVDAFMSRHDQFLEILHGYNEAAVQMAES